MSKRKNMGAVDIVQDDDGVISIEAKGSGAAPCSPSYYTFRNRDGQTVQLRGDLTMEDLIRMGYTDIRLVQPEKPLAPHEWRADPISSENTKDHLREASGGSDCS
jgi:hypothetical protein